MAYKYTLAVYKTEIDWDRGQLYWSESYETEEEAYEVARKVEQNFPGCITSIYEDEEEEY